MDFATRQASIKSVLTCGICKKLCKKVTIIEECCHRFCKKCITKKITEEKSHICPVCNLDLGCAPLQKIRPDNQVQEIRDIFSNRRKEYIERGIIEGNSKKGESKKVAEDNNAMLIDNPLPATSSRIKEKSISSLVSTKPEVSNNQNVPSGRRKGHVRNANAPRFQDPIKFDLNVEHKLKGDQSGSSSTPLLSGKATQNKEQVESAAETSKNDISKKPTPRKGEPLDGMNDLWEPLNTLVIKGVSLGNSNKSKSTEPASNFAPIVNLEDEDEEEDDEDDEEYVPSKTKEHKVSKPNVQKEETRSTNIPAAAPSSTSGKGKKGRRGRKKKETLPSGGGSSNAPEVRVTNEATSSSRKNERTSPIWFTLVASDKQESPSPLPQIPSRYIKIKDVNMPASYIKKYLAQKLSLQSEDEVEIRMLGLPILPALPLYRLVELWLRAAPSSEIRKAKVGGSAKDFVMVLTYSRNLRPQPH
ncbi:E3 ubiquitin protein ligase DRIP2-like [Nicotiana tabacum]|uniref:E3 ubiquitin protein ligase DRIP2-like n=1 Tax=Nicotiana tabacum TaxID=4097 RepID=A0AC58SNB8_TOBAC